uniref:Uncharacterized protein n=1 Tax=Lepeophtheirus salmonis TaxID=72036 RepID=A0A0K2TSN5_LEPSM
MKDSSIQGDVFPRVRYREARYLEKEVVERIKRYISNCF